MEGPVSSIGSPPHAWGILTYGTYGCLRGRFTPTCVGNTSTIPSRSPVVTVHPHMRGEYGGKGGSVNANAGSPPHAWGIHIFALLSGRRLRFTPTCVGNTQAQGKTLAEARGSPPHAWGIHVSTTSLVTPFRFTPTCVGNTGLANPRS